MGHWSDLPNWEWRGPTPNQGGAMLEQRGLVVHIAEGGYEGTISWCRNPESNVSSHFIVGVSGQIAQMVDTDVTAWTQRAGNGHWLSVENSGFTPNPLTAAQVEANAQILAKGHLKYGYPLQLAANPDGKGLGHHSMGCDWPGGAWGHCDCPGPAIIAQKPAILARAIQIVGGDMVLTDAEIEKIATAVWNRDVLAGTDTKPAWQVLGESYRMLLDLTAHPPVASEVNLAAESVATVAKATSAEMGLRLTKPAP